MSTSDFFDPETLYRQGLQHFNRANWQGAIAAFTEIQANGAPYPGVEDLLADARLKAQMASAEAPMPLAPPRGPLLRRTLLATMVLLMAIGGYQLLSLLPSTPVPTAAVARAVPTAAPAAPEPAIPMT